MQRFIPILMSTEMVKAERSGHKTDTRRMRGLEEFNESPNDWEYVRFYNGHAKFWEKHNALNEKYVKCPYGEPGNILWVRESWQWEGDVKWTDVFAGDHWWYKADEGVVYEQGPARWKPSIHMPKLACRRFLKVTDINVERLHDITPADILKEGIKYPVSDQKDGMVSPLFKLGEDNSALSFMPDGWQKLRGKELEDKILFAHWAELWCEINGRSSWDKNPWVWVISFKRISKPTNFI